MNDTRVKSFRDALERLTESLDATIRVERWDPADAVPEPLSRLAAELAARIELVRRLAAGAFSGSSGDVAKMNAMRVATERLTAAYGAYREVPEAAPPVDPRLAAMVLEEELGQVRAETAAWTA